MSEEKRRAQISNINNIKNDLILDVKRCFSHDKAFELQATIECNYRSVVKGSLSISEYRIIMSTIHLQLEQES